MNNFIAEINANYPNSIFSHTVGERLLKTISETKLAAGNTIAVRFDWCGGNNFKVNTVDVNSTQLDYTNYPALANEKFVELLEKNAQFKEGKKGSMLEITFILDENLELHLYNSAVMSDNNRNMGNHSKNCGDGYVVYMHQRSPIDSLVSSNAPNLQPEVIVPKMQLADAEPNIQDNTLVSEMQPTKVPDMQPTVVAENSMDEPDDAESEYNDDASNIDTPRSETSQEKIVDNLRKQEMERLAAKNKHPRIIEKIDAVISSLLELRARNYNDPKQFDNLSNKYEEMITFIDEYLHNDTIHYETTLNSQRQINYSDFKKEWPAKYKPIVKKQYNLLVMNTSDYWFNFMKKRDDFVDILKNLRNDINVNFFGNPTIRGGRKTRRRGKNGNRFSKKTRRRCSSKI